MALRVAHDINDISNSEKSKTDSWQTKVGYLWKVMAEVNEALDLANDESECALAYSYGRTGHEQCCNDATQPGTVA